ncbi:MAG: RHS repeat domain-containing protein [Rudaea sp.]
MLAVLANPHRIKQNHRRRRRVASRVRLPGQYADAETGLNYNFFRDYEAGTGRYIESDPIGLKAGISTYTYVQGNSFAGADKYGLAKCTGHWIQVGSVMANLDFLGAIGTLINNNICRCVWLCVTCKGPYMWSGDPHDPTLPRTTGRPVGMGGEASMSAKKNGTHEIEPSPDSCLCDPPS